MKSLQEIVNAAEKIRSEIEDGGDARAKRSYAAAIEVSELAVLIRDLAQHMEAQRIEVRST
jgi:hypothetical protein